MNYLCRWSTTEPCTRRHRYLKHLINIRFGYLAVKLSPRITTYLKQVSMSVGLRGIVRSRTSSVNDLLPSRSEPGTERLLCALVSIGCLFAAVPAFAQADLAGATTKLKLQVATAILGEKCRRIEAPDSASLVSVSLHRTFHDDFDAHP